ncbi:MAG: hypothetical protein GEV13_09005 [Rhodospirillales bacterium]|nr:hypothetical protein [Rhodospirillales bacterium]
MESKGCDVSDPVSWPQATERLGRRFGKDCLIGAGTVLSAADCARVADIGGRLMADPNVDADVLAMAQARRMVTMPGVFTLTEALLAVRRGASALKFFPASILRPSGIAAQLAVLAAYVAAGIRVFGLGSSLYRPGMTAAEVRERVPASVRAYDQALTEAAG